LGAVLSAISGMSGVVYSAVKQSKYYFFSSVFGAVTSIVCNILFIPLWGILGASLSVVCSFCVMAISRVCYAWKYVMLQQIYKYLGMLIMAIFAIVSAFFCETVISFLIVNALLLLLLLWQNRD
jgi:O-antigen/teichoic acid export membrane protein